LAKGLISKQIAKKVKIIFFIFLNIKSINIILECKNNGNIRKLWNYYNFDRTRQLHATLPNLP
jgi:hypothetical protein